MTAKTSKLAKGFSLIEMLVATLILSFGLLGMAGLQAISLKNNNNAYFRTQANLAAYEIIDSMRVNRTAALNGDYDISVGASANSSNALANADITAWAGTVADLPGGQGGIDCDANDVCTITVQWQEPGRGQTSILVSTEI